MTCLSSLMGSRELQTLTQENCPHPRSRAERALAPIPWRCAMALIGTDGPAVLISARTAAWLERYADLSSLRVRVRGTDPEVSAHLEQIRYAAMSWRGSATGTTDDTEAEPAASSKWLTTGQAAGLLQVTPRAVRKAIARGALAAEDDGGRYRISREDLEHYRAARAA